MASVVSSSDATLAALAGYGYRTAYTLNPTSYQDPTAPLQLGRRRIVGGQEDMIIDVAYQLAQERD